MITKMARDFRNKNMVNAPSNSLMDSTVSPKGENNGRIKSWGTLPGS